MTVEKVFPCYCIDHKPDGADSVYYGMPILKVAGRDCKPSRKLPPQLYEYECPNCGRGGVGFQYPSAFKALRAWNEMQRKMWRIECCEILTGETREGCPEWRREILKEMEVENDT